MKRVSKVLGMICLCLGLLPFCIQTLAAQSSFSIALLTYNGGGDWYANPSALPNLVAFCNQELNTNIDQTITEVNPGDQAIFNFPFIHMTGHGNVTFSAQERENLRTYLNHGGFLHIDDNYGMKSYIIPQIKNLFPNNELKEIPLDHPIYNISYKFPEGIPKIHEHDGLPPKAMGIFHKNKLVLLLTLESDLSDGWEDQDVHKNPESLRQKALQMGANIIKYSFEKPLLVE